MTNAKLGFFTVGLNTYWEQFEGLRQTVLESADKIRRKLPEQIHCIDGGLVDDFEKAIQVNRVFEKEQVDMIFCYCATYSPSSNVLPVIQNIKAPVIVLNLQSKNTVEYSRWNTIGQWLGTLSCAATPEITAVLLKKGVKYDIITGNIEGDLAVDNEIVQWCRVATVLSRMKNYRVGLFGHAFPGMMDLYVDETRLYNELGIYTDFLEFHQIKREMEEVSEEDLVYFKTYIPEKFELSVNQNTKEFNNLCQVCAGMWKLLHKKQLDAIALHFSGDVDGELSDVIGPMNIVLSVLISLGVPCCVEGDIKTTVAMSILKLLSGCCTTAELYGMDFQNNICLIGHSGSSDCSISNRKPVLKESEVFHGKSGKGYLTQFFIAEGSVTMLALSEDQNGHYRFITAMGESEKGEILMLGDTNTRVRFNMPVKDFINQWCMAGPSHHFALALGNQLTLIKKIAYIYGIEVLEIK